MRQSFGTWQTALDLGPSGSSKNSNVTPKCPYKKPFELHQRALFSHFTWKNTRSLPIYLGKHKVTWKITRSPPGAHRFTWKTQGAHQEPPILPRKHKEPTRRSPFYLEKHKEPTKSPILLGKTMGTTRSPPFYSEKHKEPTFLSPTGKYNNF